MPLSFLACLGGGVPVDKGKGQAASATETRNDADSRPQQQPPPKPSLARPSVGLSPQQVELWQKVLSEISEANGFWIQKLQHSVAALLHLVPGGTVSLSVVSPSKDSSVVVAAQGRGVEPSALGVPVSLLLAGQQMSSVEKVIATRELLSKALGPGGVDFSELPPDWQAMAGQHKLSSFMCIPLFRAGNVVGVVSLASPQSPSDCILSLIGKERLSALSAVLAPLLLSPQLTVACTMLHDVGRSLDIDQLTRALGMGVLELCSATYYQAPTCRVALICQGASMAAVFEMEPGGVQPSQSSTHNSAHSNQQVLPPPASPMNGHSFRCRRSSSTDVLCGMAQRQQEGAPTSPNGRHRRGSHCMPLQQAQVNQQTHQQQQAASMSRAGSVPASPCVPLSPRTNHRRSRLSLESGHNPSGSLPAEGYPASPMGLTPGGMPTGPQSYGMYYPAGSSSMGRQPSLAVESLNCLMAGGKGVARGHALPLRSTLLKMAVDCDGGAAWVADCTSYVQEGHAYLHDQVISNSNRTVNSMVVAAGYVRVPETMGLAATPNNSDGSSSPTKVPQQSSDGMVEVPLLASYCTFRTAQPDLLLASLAADLQQLMQVVAPLVWRKLQREMGAEWQLLQDRVAGSHRRHAPHGVLKSVTDPLPRGGLGSPAPIGSEHARLDEELRSPSGRLQSESEMQLAEQRASLHLGMSDPTNVASPSALARMSAAGSCVSSGHPASFRIERAAGGRNAGNKMAPIMAGVHDKLMQMQMSRLLYGAAIEHEEELEAIVVLNKIGEGGFAAVYHGKFHGLDVAIKIMKQGGGGGAGAGLRAAAAGGGGMLAGPLLGRGAEHSSSGNQQHISTADCMSKACELAVMFSVSHPNIVQVMTFFTDVHVVETEIAPGKFQVNLEPILPVLASSMDVTPAMLGAAGNVSRTSSHEAKLHMLDGGSSQDGSANEERQNLAASALSNAGSIVICMELCDMGTLWRAVRKGAFRHGGADVAGGTPRMVALYHTLLEVALALRHLHSLSLVHCDIKASNVLLKSNKLDPRGFTCKLSDFGLAKLMAEDEDGNLTISRDISSGTLTHMAPEIFTRHSRPTSAVDVYAVGIMMYELITGETAYKGVEVADAIKQVVQKQLRPQFPAFVPQDYRALAEVCWDQDPAARPDTPTLVNILEALLYEATAADKAGAKATGLASVSAPVPAAAAAVSRSPLK